MKAGDFFRGICVGMVAGAAADMVLCGGKKCKCKTVVGKTMERVGHAADTVAQDIGDMLR